jgi:hypothetical protein
MSSFLDNRSDIILDCVLTDYGRKLLAQGDGSFNIVKFAFGDDEIDYTLFNSGAVSTLRDVDIMNTPVLEAMTNNAASMKSKLLTIATKNQLFLPVMKVQSGANYDSGSFFSDTYKGWAVSVDTAAMDTYTHLTASNSVKQQGVLSSKVTTNVLRIDQGFDSSLTDNTVELSPDLMEMEYNVVIDSRFGYLVDNTGAKAEAAAVDDDMMATYKFTFTPGDKYVSKVPLKAASSDDSTIQGSRGTRLQFSIRQSDTLTSNAYFDRYGITATGTVSFKVIKTVVRVTGANTGYSVDLPVAFVKKA